MARFHDAVPIFFCRGRVLQSIMTLKSVFDSFSTMTIYEWALVILLVIAVAAILVYLFADTNTYGMNEEGFLDEHFTSASTMTTENETAFQGPIDLRNLSDLTPLNGGTMNLLLVYDDNCPHCRDFKPTWNSLASKYSGQSVKFYQAGNSNADVRYQVEKQYNVQGYPTLLYFSKGAMGEYQNLRDFSSISTFIDQQSSV